MKGGKLNDPEWLYYQYKTLGKTQEEIANIVGTSRTPIRNKLREYDIDTRESKTLEERFWEKVDIGADNECWNWKAAKNASGYGLIKQGRDNKLAHRLSMELDGENPGDSFVLHKCDNPSCINPEHLYIGNNSDNMKDAYSRGNKSYDGKKLDRRQVINIKKMLGNGTTHREIANEFGVSSSCISAIHNGDTWENVGDNYE